MTLHNIAQKVLGRLSSTRLRCLPWLPKWVNPVVESTVHPHVPDERADLFRAFNAGTTELEVLNWLHATIMVLKPNAILETGAADGVGTIALASACRINGFGVVHSVELDPKLCESLREKLEREGLLNFVNIHCGDSRKYLAECDTVFEFSFFDSMCEIRADEFETALRRGILRNMAVFHDTSARRCESMRDWPAKPLHDEYRRRLFELANDGRCTGHFESSLSRGFVCIFLK
jgi:predicted O-methyltransferase YrrM